MTRSRSSDYQKYYKFCRDPLDDIIVRKGLVVDKFLGEVMGTVKPPFYFCDCNYPHCHALLPV